MNKESLIEFENEIASLFNSAKIKAPIHLYHNTEDLIIRIFENIDIQRDWVCCTWRNHYQALLKGIPPNLLKEKIMDGKSMVMNLPEYKFICSSIVGGIPSIATGLALAAKLKNTDERVWCWTGDMSAETGAWAEAYKYSVAHNLPIKFIVEDNELSVLTPTKHVWGENKWYLPKQNLAYFENDHLVYYKYTNDKYPHAGAGIRVQF
jgi:pyruvate dehydrogenase E1 component alpha subunit